MRINFNSPINDYDGENIIISGRVMTVGEMTIAALNTLTEAEKDLSAEKKIGRATLSQKIHDAMKGDGLVDVSIEELSEIKALMNPLYAPLPLMGAFNIFDPAPVVVDDGQNCEAPQ